MKLVAVVAVAIAAVAAVQYEPAAPFSFALIGDNPYDESRYPGFKNMVDAINAEPFEFVVHTGDIKGGGEVCTNERILASRDFYRMFEAPFVLALGDNDWTDCHRESNGGWNPVERLEFLRKKFYVNDDRTDGPNYVRVVRQSSTAGFEDYRENFYFEKNSVILATLNIPGSTNGLRPWDGIGEMGTDKTIDKPAQCAQEGLMGMSLKLCEQRLDEYQARLQANKYWVRRVFERAMNRNMSAVVIIIQANFFDQYVAGWMCEEYDEAGFRWFEKLLGNLAVEFGKPVLLLHGDSHYFRVDRPFLVSAYDQDGNAENRRIHNILRVMNWGSADNYYVRIDVDPKSASPFKISDVVPEGNEPVYPTTVTPQT